MEKCGVGSLLHFCEFLCYCGSEKKEMLSLF